ncbi:MAG TPA: UDP-3-O-acyl-N-acetylglucosamine deacetylase [Phycisphaerales bacterium]|nr:UDP-3-O-acyl-N-acetylglucosamine deacetylase [Phycisphaerales bacterium]
MPPALHGTGLFSAKPAAVTFVPAACATGLRFVVDGAVVPALVDHVTTDTSWSGLPAGFPVRNTTLRSGNAARPVATTEHVMSALAGLGLWHMDVHLDGVECPILDGSAAGLVDALGSFPASVPTPPLVLTRRVEVRDDRGASIVGEPLGKGERARYTYELEYGATSPVRPQAASWDLSRSTYISDVAPARTFSLLAEVEAARRAGLFAHLTPRDMLVVGDDGQPIDNEWRFPDAECVSTEPARHKLLDLIGDLALLGRPLHARVVARRSGHALTHQFCRAVLASETGRGLAT